MRIIPALIVALVALGTLGAQAGAAAGGSAEIPTSVRPHRCVLLPASRQPKPASHLGGGLVLTIPATTCNTPATTPAETGATGRSARR